MLAAIAFSLLSALAARAVPCVQFDTSGNLYAFGGSEDVNLGANTTWSQPSAKTLSTSGRPPWTGNSTQCLLNQYSNIMYVIGSDASDLSAVYVYNFAGDSWSKQATSGQPSNLGGRSGSVLDHDTVVIFTLPSGSGASLYQLDLSSVTSAASSDSLAWSVAATPSFSTDGYTPTLSEASNHIAFFGVPSTAAGSADLFVIHYNYFQPDVQTFSGTSFPDTAGQAINVPNGDNTQYQMVFFPNDFSNTYVVTHWTNAGDYSSTADVPFSTTLINSTQTLPAPTSQDQQAAYAASSSALVQIDSAGDIYYMTDFIGSDYTVQSSATWTKMSYSLSGLSGSSSNSTTSASGSSTAAGASSTASASGSGKASGSASASASASSSASSKSGAAAPGAVVGKAEYGLLMAGLAAIGAALL